jgi:hypothetical protein
MLHPFGQSLEFSCPTVSVFSVRMGFRHGVEVGDSIREKLLFLASQQLDMLADVTAHFELKTRKALNSLYLEL